MTDNVVLDAMSGGATVASKDVGGAQHQRVVLTVGGPTEIVDVGPARPLPTFSLLAEAGRGAATGWSTILVQGRNPDIDNAPGTFEALWEGGGAYTGHAATAAETLEVFSADAADAGTVRSSGTATGGSSSSLVDSGADFVSDGVSIGDFVALDSIGDHAVVLAVSSTTLTLGPLAITGGAVQVGHDYRVVGPASTGLYLVRASGLLDGSLASAVEYLVLDGTTPVDSTGTYLRASRIDGIAAGSGGANAGVLTARQKTTTANVFASIPAGASSNSLAAWTVPAGMRAWVYGWAAGICSGANGTSRVEIIARRQGEVFRRVLEHPLRSTGSSGFHKTMDDLAGPFPPGTDFVLQADSNVDNLAVCGSFGLLFEAL